MDFGTVITKYEKEVLEKLKNQGEISWPHTSRSETKALKRLCRKGLATQEQSQLDDWPIWTPVDDE